MGDDELKRAVCLTSGGLDSTVAATVAKKEGYLIHLFHISYGQKAENKEHEVVKRLKEALGAEELVSVNLDIFKNLSALTTPGAAIPIGADVDMEASFTPPTWVQCRNLVFVSLAAAYAEHLGAERIYVGFNAEEGRSYPDNRPEFRDRFNLLLEKAVASFSRPLRIEAPLIDMMKPEIVRLGCDVLAPIDLTWSCYLDGDLHCGVCESCQHRHRGFLDAGVEDPTAYL